MIPIRDDNPTHHTPYVTIALIVVNALVFLVEVAQPGGGMQRFIWKYGFVPAELVSDSAAFDRQLRENPPTIPALDVFGRPVRVPDREAFAAATALPASINIFTCMFLHGGWMHLIGNMLYLWIFGNNIEDRLGPGLFVVFYLATGVAGNLAHTLFDPGVVPLVGASGAISGVLGAYILLFPHAHVLAIVPLGWYWFTTKLPAWLFLGIYIVLQNLFPAVLAGAQGSGVAYWAHIGGFGAGFAAIRAFPQRRVQSRARVARYRVIDDDDADVVI